MFNQMSLYGDELLVAALAQAKPNSTFHIKNEAQIIRAFYEIGKRPEMIALFRNYTFDTDGLEPRSSAISEGIESLQQSRLLKRQNPDLVEYTISPAIKERYELFIERKVRGKKKLIKELGEAICRELGVTTLGQNEST